jgi:hypothetical protein
MGRIVHDSSPNPLQIVPKSSIVRPSSVHRPSIVRPSSPQPARNACVDRLPTNPAPTTYPPRVCVDRLHTQVVATGDAPMHAPPTGCPRSTNPGARRLVSAAALVVPHPPAPVGLPLPSSPAPASPCPGLPPMSCPPTALLPSSPCPPPGLLLPLPLPSSPCPPPPVLLLLSSLCSPPPPHAESVGCISQG